MKAYLLVLRPIHVLFAGRKELKLDATGLWKKVRIRYNQGRVTLHR